MSRIYYDKEKGHYCGEKITEKVTKSLNLCLMKAEDTIDLYTIGAFCMIIDPDKV